MDISNYLRRLQVKGTWHDKNNCAWMRWYDIYGLVWHVMVRYRFYWHNIYFAIIDICFCKYEFLLQTEEILTTIRY
jgi:hypothetical protein